MKLISKSLNKCILLNNKLFKTLTIFYMSNINGDIMLIYIYKHLLAKYTEQHKPGIHRNTINNTINIEVTAPFNMFSNLFRIYFINI